MRTSIFAVGALAALAACGSGESVRYAPGTASIETIPVSETRRIAPVEVISKSDLEKRDFVGLDVSAQRLTQSVAMRALALPGAEARRVDDGFVITVPAQALFTHPSSAIIPARMPYLTRLAAALHRDPSVSLDVISHYHYDGMNRKALAESQKRAVAIQAALMSREIPASRVRAIGAGDRNPVASNRDPVGQQANRRIEFHFRRGE